jgi:hypothetical protein
MAARTTAAVWVKGIAEMLAAEGLDVGALFAATGIDAAALAAPGARLPTERISQLWELAVARSGNPALALAQHQVARPASFDVVGYTMMSCADLRCAFERLIRYMLILSDALTMTMEQEAGGDRITFVLFGGDRPMPRQRIEFICISVISFCRWISRRDIRPAGVEFAYPVPADGALYREAFRCPVVFDAPRHSILFARADMTAPRRPPIRSWPSCTNASPAIICASSITPRPPTACARSSSAACRTASRGATRWRASCA